MDNDVLDLDALAPQPRRIKFGGEVITVNPPTTAQILKLGSFGQKMQKMEELSEGEAQSLVEAFTQQLREIIPGLAGADLGTGQILALSDLIVEMATPSSTKELEKRKITPLETSKVQ